MTMIQIVIDVLGNHQRIGTGIGGFENKRTNGDHSNYSSVEIG